MASLCLLGLSFVLASCQTKTSPFVGAQANQPSAVQRIQNGVQLNTAAQNVRVQFYAADIVRVVKWVSGGTPEKLSLVVIETNLPDLNLQIQEDAKTVTLGSGKVTLQLSKRDGAIRYLDGNQQNILQEQGAAQVAPVKIAFETNAFSIRQNFKLTPDEGIYGLGQHQSGYMNYRGRTVKLVQANTQSAIPLLVSTRGYGILWDNYSKTIFSDDQKQASFWSEVADNLDYYFIYGKTMDGTIAGYRDLTGHAPMYGKWAYGYWQSKEHYATREELLGVAQEYRRRQIPIDGLVQDWHYWGGNENWSGMFFDKTTYPDPKGMIDILHRENSHLMISIWAGLGAATPIYKEMEQRGFLYPTVGWANFKYFDAYNPAVGDSLYKLDANGTLTAIEPGILSAAGVNGGFQVFNGNLNFFANDSSNLHAQFISLDDNTTSGITFQAYDVNLGQDTNSFTSSPTVFGVGPPCFASGTRILTDCGAVAVENLAVGDRLITRSGEVRPIKWIGHISLVCSRSPDPRDVWPIRVAAGAFAENRPSCDLWLSPGHNIAAEGVLMPISALQNGKTIVQHQRATVEYWHVELDKHDIIFAEDLAVESYLDTGNRAAFANGVAFIGAHPDFEPSHWSDTCLPLVKGGVEVARVKTALLERLGSFGCVATSEADIHVMADRKRIEPIKLGARRFAFVLPRGCVDIRLKSRTFIPAYTRPESIDDRSLGICIKRLQIDGEAIALESEALLSASWHGLETDQRWTRGSAPLPANSRLVVIDLAAPGRYWREPGDNVVALFA